MALLYRFKIVMLALTGVLLVVLVVHLLDRMTSEADLSTIFLAMAITLSTVTTLVLSLEALQTARQGQEAQRHERLRFLSNMLNSCEVVLAHGLEEVSGLKARAGAGLGEDDVDRASRVREHMRTLSHLLDLLFRSDAGALLVEELASIGETVLRLRMVEDDMTAVTRGTLAGASDDVLSRDLRHLEHVDRHIKAATTRVKSELDDTRSR